jgi:thiol-disulfide isomerase/thioredoxin
MKKPVLVALALLGLVTAAPRPAEADPTAVCSPLHPIATDQIEVRIFGATWCGACEETERFLSSIGATDSASVLVDGRRVTVRLRHLDVDSISETERAAMRGDGIPEVQLVVRGQVVFYQAGSITSSAALDRFVDGGLETGGCVLDGGRGGGSRRPAH